MAGLAFQFPPPYSESQRRASSAASPSSSRSARPTCPPPQWSAVSSAGVTSHLVTGVVKAEAPNDPSAAVQNADLRLHLTEWPQFSHIDLRHFAARAGTPRVIDGRGTLDTETWRQAGWTVRALGRP